MSERDLRVSDDERNHVVGLLEKATGRGMIDLNEFAERSATATAAKTRGELNAVLVDLPGMVHSSAPAGAREQTLSSSMTLLKRDGAWTPPLELHVRNTMATTILDFRQALINYPRLVIDFDVSFGTVRLWLPEHATINLEGFTCTMGNVVGRGRPVETAETPGDPHFVITGQLRMCSLVVHRKK
ncbi:DUF1707 SHOCT-like domain-containing protein [Sciscionella marina]|uniref:DUF1707 SHOCT-like domain-containing protein n=1 Tax=Sciscionella marina TaxID=508770 RepID=UPI000362D261|nr:DUF1707 domain-containing protein [Sciscionella marina]